MCFFLFIHFGRDIFFGAYALSVAVPILIFILITFLLHAGWQCRLLGAPLRLCLRGYLQKILKIKNLANVIFFLFFQKLFCSFPLNRVHKRLQLTLCVVRFLFG